MFGQLGTLLESTTTKRKYGHRESRSQAHSAAMPSDLLYTPLKPMQVPDEVYMPWIQITW